MIPVRLSLQGVFSYIEKQEIDFSSLTDAGLFGIFGKVGSGKSSIVDAITFVLYNNNFRLNHGGMLYNIMNLSSPSMHIEYDFRVGALLYRFSVSAKRKKNNFEETSPQTRGAYVWDNDQQVWIPTEMNAQSIIGLSYDDFRRAVIIPQNNFQEFLELKSTDRNDMMQKIFRLDKFDFSSRVKEIKDKNNNLINANEGQLKELGEINPELVESLELELKNVERRIIGQQKRLLSSQVEADELSKIKAQQDALAHRENRLRLLAEKELEQVARKSTLEAYRKALIHMKPSLERRAELTLQLAVLQKSIADNTEQNRVKEEGHSTILRQYTEARNAFENREGLRKMAEDLEKLSKIRLSTAEREQLEKRHADGEKLHRELSDKIELDKASRIKLQQELSNLDRDEIDIATVTNVLNWFNTMDGCLAQVSAEEKNHKEMMAELEAILLRKVHFHNGQLKGIDSSSTTAAIESGIAVLRQHLEKEKKSVGEQEQKILQQKMLQEQMHALHVGEPCPLCGSAEHPSPLALNMEIEELCEQLAQKVVELERKDEKLDELKDDWQDLKNEIRRHEDYVKQSVARLDQLKQTVAAEKAKFVWKSFSDTDRSAALKAREQFQVQSERKKQLNIEANMLSAAIEEDSEKLLKYQARLQQIVSEIARHNGIVSTSVQAMYFPPDHYKNEPTEVLSSRSAELSKAYQDVALQYDKLRNQLGKSEVELAELKTRLEAEQHTFDESQQKLIALIGEIEKALTVNGFKNLEEVLQLLNSGIDADAWQQQIEIYFQDLQQARADVSSAIAELNGKSYDEEKHKLLDAEVTVLQAELDGLKKLSGALETEVKTKKSNILRQAALVDTKIMLELRAANIQTLEQLFKGKAFVSYASGIYLLNLVNLANVRFQKMTHGQLMLQLDKENGFEVLDLLNDGKTRSVRTLSGGQKFQAALCLALALADGISQGSYENFFFMDEGFGSLDKESMQQVFETLQALRKENRIVGLISHVDEMQQEMDRYITVHRDEKRGSWLEIN